VPYKITNLTGGSGGGSCISLQALSMEEKAFCSLFSGCHIHMALYRDECVALLDALNSEFQLYRNALSGLKERS
jgi:hypothetical protein